MTQSSSTPTLSVVIPAFNAERTLRRSCASLRAQRFGDWEAIIVDDGSADDTTGVAERLARQDRRFRIIRRENGGPSAARNSAIADARGRWLLFLDADDEIAPGALEALIDAVDQTPAASWFYGGWTRIVGTGAGVDALPEPMPDPRARIAVGCPFAIHACLVRTDAVRAVGMFDEGLRTCEDWDLWRKLAAAGHVPHPVEEIVAVYLVRADSASSVTKDMLADGFEVIERSFAGAPVGEREAARVAFASYLAGIEIGRGGDPSFVLDALGRGSAPDADPTLLASFLVTAVPLGAGVPLEQWLDIPCAAQKTIVDFLNALGTHVGARRLSARTVRRLELEVARIAAPAPTPRRLFDGVIVDVDLLTGPPPDLAPPASADRVHLRALLDQRVVATTEMVVLGPVVTGRELADGLVEGVAWRALEASVLEPLLPTLTLHPDGSAQEVRRGDVVLGHVDGPRPGDRALLNAVGWPLFIQELFGEPRTEPNRFYDVRGNVGKGRVRASDSVTVELRDLPTIWSRAARVHVDVRVAGAPFDALVLAPAFGRITAGRLRTQLLMRNGVQLARAAMSAWLAHPRSAGTPLADVLLRDRERSSIGPHAATWVGHDVHRGPVPSRLLHRTAEGPIAGAISNAADAFGRPVIRRGAPDVVALSATSPPDPSRTSPVARPARTTVARRSAASFDALFADDDDPWAYTTGYEQRKYEQTLELIPDGVDRALELACAEGHFTVQLAPKVNSLTCTDVSQLALERAAARCNELGNVSFQRHDLFAAPVEGRWPLIVCSEVLYYAGGKQDLVRVVASIVDALEPEGVLVTAHANLVIDDPDSPGFDWDEDYGSLGIQEALLATGTVKLEHEIVTPMYRVQRYRRTIRSEVVTVTEVGEPSPDLSPDVAAHFLPHGGRPARTGPPASRPISVPILMYHRISPDGLDAMRRWRVTPEEFATQLDFLSQAGYTTISPDQWRDAVLLGAKLPEQPLLLTFDDGYQDFADHAFPALQARDMTATVMLVTGHVGKTNGWDAHREGLPLMDWGTIRRLQERGITFGAHTTSHVPLTAVKATTALQEIAESIGTIRRELGVAPAGFAYPYGDVTPGVRDLVGLCSVDLAFSCVPGVATAQDDALMLPRVEVRGDAPLKTLVAELATW